jgi:uncharacterized membrane protein
VKWWLVLLVGCADAPLTIDDYPCPPSGTQLTYESFGKSFLGAACNGCHSADEGYRHGAPEAYRFDTLDEVRSRADRIFVRAAASNTSMPPGPDDPNPDDRDRLAEWLACGAP